MTRGGWPVMPGVPAAGHVSRGGYWHPGALDRCQRCSPCSAVHPSNKAWHCTKLDHHPGDHQRGRLTWTTR